MNKKKRESETGDKDVSTAKVIHNLIMLAGALGSFAFFGSMGILIFMFVAFYIFK